MTSNYDIFCVENSRKDNHSVNLSNILKVNWVFSVVVDIMLDLLNAYWTEEFFYKQALTVSRSKQNFLKQLGISLEWNSVEVF